MPVATQADAFAPAKINLTLHVTGQRADGYHLLDSLVVFADVGDCLWFEPQDAMGLEVVGPFAAGVPTDARNLVWQAAEKAGQTAAITLEKNLPHGAGIGGGSTDAAAVLRHFGAVAGAAQLGADVPVCLAAVAQRMQGIGDVLTPLPEMPALHAVLVNPGVHVPTPSVFRALVQKENPPMRPVLPRFQTSEAFTDWLTMQRNDLQAPAQAAAPEITHVLQTLSACPGVQLTRMSGSGATCFGLFANLRATQDAAHLLQEHHPAWWIKACSLS